MCVCVGWSVSDCIEVAWSAREGGRKCVGRVAALTDLERNLADGAESVCVLFLLAVEDMRWLGWMRWTRWMRDGSRTRTYLAAPDLLLALAAVLLAVHVWARQAAIRGLLGDPVCLAAAIVLRVDRTRRAWVLPTAPPAGAVDGSSHCRFRRRRPRGRGWRRPRRRWRRPRRCWRRPGRARRRPGRCWRCPGGRLWRGRPGV